MLGLIILLGGTVPAATLTIAASDAEYDDDGGVVDLGQVDGSSPYFFGWEQTAPFNAGNSFVSDLAASNGVSSLIESSNGEVLMLRHVHPATDGISVKNTIRSSARPAGMTVSLDLHYATSGPIATLFVGGILMTFSDSFGVDFSDENVTFQTIPGLAPSAPMRIQLLYNGDGTADLTVTRLTDNTVFSYTNRTLSPTAYGLFLLQIGDDDSDIVMAFNNLSIDIPNRAPTDIGLSPASVDENEPANTVVGTLSTTDPDNPAAAQTFTYALVSGSGSTDNASFAIVGSELRTAASLDHEVGATRSVRVEVTDSGSPALTFEKELTITIGDVNETPTLVAGTGLWTVQDDTATTMTVTQLETTDPEDSPTGIVYTVITAPTIGSLELNGTPLSATDTFTQQDVNSGAVVFVADPGANSDSIRLEVRDSGNITLTAFDLPIDILGPTSVMDWTLLAEE